MIKALVITGVFALCGISAAFADTDCSDAITGTDKQETTENGGGIVFTVSKDDYGIKESCRNKWPSFGERYIMRRVGTDPFSVVYNIERKYCLLRNLTGSKQCLSKLWIDTYTTSFNASEAKPLSNGDVRHIMRNGLGLFGAHVCLKQFKPGDVYPHGSLNNTINNKVCGYLVNTLVSGACTSPFVSWTHALIGCVDVPPNPGPPTFNSVIPASISPFVDPTIGLQDSLDSSGHAIQGYLSMGSTFDQPLIKLLNGSSVGGELLLRYRDEHFARDIDNIPSSGVFPSEPGSSPTVYYAVIDPSMPDKVCACSATGCLVGSYVGCAPRPTPRMSGFKLVAQYVRGSTAPYDRVVPIFVKEDKVNRTIYKDGSGALAMEDAAGTIYRLNPEGSLSSTLATPPIGYQEVLPYDTNPESALQEYTAFSNGSWYSYVPYNVFNTFELQFSAVAAALDSEGAIMTLGLDTPSSRIMTDGCAAYSVAEDQTDANNERRPILSGARSRDYCVCPESIDSGLCTVAKETACYDGTVHLNDADAQKVLCPGQFKGLSRISNQNVICLQLISAWQDAIDPTKDKLCAYYDPPSDDCAAVTSFGVADGMSVWPAVSPGNSTKGSCSATHGVERTLWYFLNPTSPISASNFTCQVGQDCDYQYNSVYLPKLQSAGELLLSLQKFANALGRNLYGYEVQRVRDALGDFASLHAVSALALDPIRICDPAKNGKNARSYVENSCKIQLSCSAISGVSDLNGFATWSAVRALNAQEQQDLSNNSQYKDYRISMEGTCAAGYKQSVSGTNPTRNCYIKYIDGVRVVEQWEDVQNACVPQ